MRTDIQLLLCALHSFGFALFHLGFWRLFGWPRTLEGTTRANRAILPIANLQLVWVFFGIGMLCLLYPAELAGTPLGHAVLAGMVVFWAIRTAAQFVWLRINHPLVHVLTALFALGAVLFSLPLFMQERLQARSLRQSDGTNSIAPEGAPTRATGEIAPPAASPPRAATATR